MTEARRIRPPKRYDSLIETLVDDGIFETKQAAMMFAAAVGYRFARRKTLDSPGEGIRWNIFERNRDDAFVNALGISEVREISILDPDSAQNADIATVFEEYAAGGFEYLDQHMKETAGDFLETFLGLVQQFRVSQSQPPVGLEGLDRGALELLGDLES